MATITVRDLDDEVQQRLKRRAAANNRSMEAEVRAILSQAVAESFINDWLSLAERHRGIELEMPRRTPPRVIDLS